MPEWKYFSTEEISCNCGCGKAIVDTDFMHKLIALREFCDFPFVVSSFYRCKQYNADIGGAKRSYHLLGRAIDIAVSREQAMMILEYAREFGFYGIGISQTGDERFIHLDDRNADVALWTY